MYCLSTLSENVWKMFYLLWKNILKHINEIKIPLLFPFKNALMVTFLSNLFIIILTYLSFYENTIQTLIWG